MCRTVAEVQADALALLEAGFTPEEVEDLLEAEVTPQEALTALSDPNNVLMVEVVDDGTGRS